MRKYEGKSNISGEVIKKILQEKDITKENLCRKLQLMGINIDRWHLYDILDCKVILKDFELIAISKVLNIDLNELKNML